MKSLKEFKEFYETTIVPELGELELEDQEFMSSFDVYATDHIEVCYILTPDLMARISDYTKQINRDLFLAFRKSKLYVAICHDKPLFEAPLHESLLNFEPIAQYYEDLKMALDVVESLHLNECLWTKQ